MQKGRVSSDTSPSPRHIERRSHRHTKRPHGITGVGAFGQPRRAGRRVTIQGVHNPASSRRYQYSTIFDLCQGLVGQFLTDLTIPTRYRSSRCRAGLSHDSPRWTRADSPPPPRPWSLSLPWASCRSPRRVLPPISRPPPVKCGCAPAAALAASPVAPVSARSCGCRVAPARLLGAGRAYKMESFVWRVFRLGGVAALPSRHTKDAFCIMGFKTRRCGGAGFFCSLLSRLSACQLWRLRCFRALGASRPFVSRGLLLSFLLGVPRCARHPSFCRAPRGRPRASHGGRL